jgi:hypothetical protein|tara:strand:- start:154 stop:297 length:144 start_codon:yes stop_codon:yes gene_type:complete
VVARGKKGEEEVAMVSGKKTPAQKIRNYFKTPRWKALTKKQERRYGR